MAVFETKVTLECPQQSLFDFLLRPANVARISPPNLGLCFTSAPEIVELGSRLEFKIQGFGQIQTLVHEITALEAPSRITEKQIRGLFGSWIHDHLFETNADGAVIVTDRIEFEPPAGLLGLLITKNRIIDHLEEGFDHRHDVLRKLMVAAE